MIFWLIALAFTLVLHSLKTHIQAAVEYLSFPHTLHSPPLSKEFEAVTFIVYAINKHHFILKRVNFEIGLFFWFH